MPDFLDTIHQKLSTSATPHVSRLFLVKVRNTTTLQAVSHLLLIRAVLLILLIPRGHLRCQCSDDPLLL